MLKMTKIQISIYFPLANNTIECLSVGDVPSGRAAAPDAQSFGVWTWMGDNSKILPFELDLKMKF